jgi:DNA-binding winged helix-turn-helix (wHTH) protein/Tol biopolymer transport system component
MSLSGHDFYDFGPFRLDPSERLLLRGGQPVAIPPKAYDLLMTLVARAGRLVTKEDLLKEVWPETFVEEANLSYTVSAIRKALGDESEPYRYIETIPKRGYRFKESVAASGRSVDERTPKRLRNRRFNLLAVTGLVLLLVIAAWILMSSSNNEHRSSVVRLTLTPPEGVTVQNVQVSPDGRRVAFVGVDGLETDNGSERPRARDQHTRRLWVQELDSTAAHPLPGTEGAVNPFWAPDGQRLGFNADAALKTIDLRPGVVRRLCRATNAAASWSRDGSILFQSGAVDQPLFLVSDAGGDPAPATRLDATRHELSHAFPYFLPDGRQFLYVVNSLEKQWSGVYVGSLGSPVTHRLLDVDTGAIYAKSGHLLYSRDGVIVAQSFDATRLALKGKPIPIVQDSNSYGNRPIEFSPASRAVPGFGALFGATNNMDQLFGTAVFSQSDTGLIAYAVFDPDLYQLEWFNRGGSAIGYVGTPATVQTFDLSSDAGQLAITQLKAGRANLWLYDLSRNVPMQISFANAFESNPRWRAGAHRIVLSSVAQTGQRRVVEIGLNGQQTTILDENVFLDDVSRDGRLLLYRSPQTRELKARSLSGDHATLMLHRWQQGARLDQSRFSPDGRWVAYNSDESGNFQVYVTPFPPTGERWQMSVAGGVQPIWRRDSRELYYLDHQSVLVAVEIDPANGHPGASRPLFRAPVGTIQDGVEQYATVDGARFLVMKALERRQRPINVVVDWPAIMSAQKY